MREMNWLRLEKRMRDCLALSSTERFREEFSSESLFEFIVRMDEIIASETGRGNVFSAGAAIEMIGRTLESKENAAERYDEIQCEEWEKV